MSIQNLPETFEDIGEFLSLKFQDLEIKIKSIEEENEILKNDNEILKNDNEKFKEAFRQIYNITKEIVDEN